MLNKRAQILFDEQTWSKLLALARTEKASVGELVREAVDEKYSESEKLDKRRRAVERTLQRRITVKGKIDYKELINYGRKY